MGTRHKYGMDTNEDKTVVERSLHCSEPRQLTLEEWRAVLDKLGETSSDDLDEIFAALAAEFPE